jgi:hypothetical protein
VAAGHGAAPRRADGFTAGFTAPAPGHEVGLRVTVATRAGASLTETILGAYQAKP